MQFTLFANEPLPAAEARFEARLADGSRVTAPAVANWHEPAASPSLAGKLIFDAANPFVWLIDSSLPLPQTPGAYLEFIGGDRLPGDIIGTRTGSESAYDRLPPHLLVEPRFDFDPAGQARHKFVRVTTEWLQRVVWHRRLNDEYRPGMLFLRDGREFPFRALRWKESAVSILREARETGANSTAAAGIVEFAFHELAEVHLPPGDQWDAWFDQLAMLSPTCAARLIQLEASDGLRLTASSERFRAQHRGDAGKSENWYPIVQPAWSLDPLAVPFRNVRTWRFFSPERLPLTLFTPVETLQASAFGSSRRWKMNENVEHAPLRSAGQDFGWGFGVHASNELHFPLHPAVKSFQTQLGLDQIAGAGGCVRAHLLTATRSPAGTWARGTSPLFQSAVIVGSGSVSHSGMLSLPQIDPATQARLVLVADDAHDERPNGADPFDIRDSLDWLEPELLLDGQLLRAEVTKRMREHIPAWQGWTVDGEFTLINRWDHSSRDDPRFITLVKPAAPFISLSRNVKIEKADNLLAIGVNRFEGDGIAPSRIQVRIDGKAAGEFALPVQNSPIPPDPPLVPVAAFRGRTVKVELVHIPEGEHALADWRGITSVEHSPGLVRIFEDEADFVQKLAQGEGKVTLLHEDVQSGDAAIEILPYGRANPRLPGLSAQIREYPQLGQYRFLRFAWKKRGGEQIGISLGHDGDFGELPQAARNDRPAPLDDAAGAPRLLQAGLAADFGRPRLPRLDSRGIKHGYRYYAGRGEPKVSPALHLGGLPQDWKLEQRDLFAEMGDFTLTGLALLCPDGDDALFDHIYLARNPADFDRIADWFPSSRLGTGSRPESATRRKSDDEGDPNVVRHVRDRWEVAELLSQVAPLFSTDASADGAVLLKVHAGRQNVVRTHPLDKGKPCILRAAVDVPLGKSTQLQIAASHQDKGDWQLIVAVAGEKLYDALVGEKTVSNGWADVTVDLSRFAGRKVIVEVHNHPNDWSAEAAFWQRIALVHP